MEVRTIGVIEGHVHLHVHLKEALALIKRDDKKFILMVSPVPLQVTFMVDDIVVSNSESSRYCVRVARK